MPQLASSNRTQLRYKLEGVYPNNFGVPQPGNGVNLNMLSETLAYDVKNESSKSIRSDRQTPGIGQVSASSAGGFAFELQHREYDPFIQGVLQGDFVEYGTNGLSDALPALTLASGSVTAATPTAGADIWTSLSRGQWFSIIPVAGASDAVKDYFAHRAFKLHDTTAPTASVLTLASITPINTTLVGTALAAGARIGSAKAVNDQTMRSYTLEVAHADASVFREYTGMVVSKLDVKLSVGSIVTGSFEFMGKSMNLLGATNQGGSPAESQTFAPINATRGVFDIFEGGESITATTYIKSGEFTISNNLRMQDAVGVFGAAGIGVGAFKAMGKMEVYLADRVMYQKLLSGVASSLTIPLLDVDGNGYVFHFASIKYTAAKVNTGGLDQDNMLQMDWETQLDPDVNSPTYNKTVAIYRVGRVGNIVAPAADTRPRFGLGNADAYNSPQALLDSMTAVPGSSNGGKAGTFELTTTAGNYGWVAVEADVSEDGVRFFDGTGYGGWSGAGMAGNNAGASPDPTTSTVTFTDGDGITWRLFRQDYVNANPGGQNYTLS